MTGAQAAGLSGREADSAAASAVKAMQADGRHAEARERYAELVGRHQRRATRIAFHYMRDAAEADEAVQDAFVKAYSHLASFREELPFEVWFTRILINGCLDRIKARTRRERWIAPMPEGPGGERDFAERMPAGARRRRISCWRASGGRSWPRARQAAGAAALGVHAEPFRGLHVARSERVDRPERIDGARASVPGDPQAADAVGKRRTPEVRGETPCPFLTN